MKQKRRKKEGKKEQRGSLLSPLSFSGCFRLPHVVCGHSCSFLRAVPLSTCCVCVDGTLVWLESVFLHSCARILVPQPCGHHSRGEALLRRAFRPPSARCLWRRAPWPLLCRRSTLADQANPHSADSCRTSAASDSCGCCCLC